MGAKQADGMYLSTEKGNRYEREGKPAKQVEVEIENPKVTDLVENGKMQHEKINQLLNEEKVTLEDISPEYWNDILKYFKSKEGNPKKDLSSITPKQVTEWYRKTKGKDISEDYFSQRVRTEAAKLITEQLKSEGYDALYFPQKTKIGEQEGELIVFDRTKVKEKEEAKLEEPTKQVKINNLIDRANSLQKMRKNDPKRAFEVNEIKRSAIELGLKYDDSYGKILGKNGMPIQKREPITNKTIVKDFNRNLYSKETNDALDFLINNIDAAKGFEMVGTDGKRLSQSQLKEALESVKKGKINYAAKAIFDFIENASTKGGIELEDITTGLRQRVPIKEYFDFIKTEEDKLAQANAEDFEKNKELEQSDEYINQLIDNYEQEYGRENNEPKPTSEEKVTETISSRTSNQKTSESKESTKTEIEKYFEEAISSENKTDSLKEFIKDNFEGIFSQLNLSSKTINKIKRQCK